MSSYYYPNNMGRMILLAMEEILGKTGIHAVLNQQGLSHRINHLPPNNLDRDFNFADLSQMMAGLEALYGPRGGQGLALRAGQACFKYGLREFGPLLGITDLAFRMLPLPAKLSKGAEIFAETFNSFSDQRVRLEESHQYCFWHIERCPVCWQRQTEQPACSLAVGILQEALYWISGGKYFQLEEVSCIARGDPSCTIQIDKQALN
ncbi:MAG: 4-vinyl reductase [Anaerolineales bacterium]|nr:4-vinyl reductase [Anaerolineales bacterium]